MSRLIAVLLAVMTTLFLGSSGADAQITAPPPDNGLRTDKEESNTAIIRSDVRLLRGNRAEYIVVGPPSQSAAAARLLQNAGAEILRIRDYPAMNRRFLAVDLRAVGLGQARALLAQGAPQTRIDLHHVYRYASGPRLYAAAMIGATPGGCRVGGMRIGVIDGPVDPRHPALAGVRVLRHSVLAPGDRAPDASHGTAVAALIAGNDPSGTLAGYASGAQIYAVTAFGKDRRGPSADVEFLGLALDWLLSQNVRLINMSFAGPVNTAFDDILQSAASRGAVMIAAAGNRGSTQAVYPAAAGPVIAVTAVDAAGRRYRSANIGSHIEFAAPGVDLFVAKSRRGGYASGTSYAAPIVTALAARLYASGTRSASGLRAALRRESRDLGDPGRDAHFGWGLVRAPDC